MSVRKKDITNYYKNRSEISTEDAEKLFCSNAVLSSVSEKFNNGLKLCAYLLQEKLGAEKSWELIRKIVVVSNPATSNCFHIGSVLRRAYRDAIRGNVSDFIASRDDISKFIFKPLMEHCVMVQRKYAEKFCLILRGSTFDRDHDISRMLFDVSTPIIWRYLNARNVNFRMGAYFIQCHVFPPVSEDEIVTTDYLAKHAEAFLNALADPVLDICLQAIEHVCEVVSIYFETIPHEHTNKVFKQLAALAEDESAKVRAALYFGLRHFCDCPLAIVKLEGLLKQICKDGIDDSSENVRCNTFRLLNALSSSRLKIFSLNKMDKDKALLSIEDVMHRLDFEESEDIKYEISRLLFLGLFERDMSNEARYKMLNQMSCINRNACLDLHRLLYTCEIADTTSLLSHISSALIVCLRMLQTLNTKQADLTDKRMDKYDFEKYIENGDEASFDENNETNTADSYKQLSKRIKNVIDCMVVCYSTMRYDSSFDCDKLVEAQNVTRYFVEIANVVITQFESNDDLLDTALSIIALVRNAGIHSSNIKHNCTRMLRSGQLNARYLEIFGLIAMDELLKLLKTGLDQLERLSSNSENGMKRKKTSQLSEFANKKIIIDALMLLLNLPSCSQYIVEKHLHFVSLFIAKLNQICDNFMANLEKQRSLDTTLLIACWKIWTILLIIRYNQDAFIDEDEVEDDKSKKKEAKVTKNSSRRSTRTQSSIIFTQVESQTRVDPLVEECNWFESHLKNNSKLVENADVVEYFYQAVELHLQAYKHSKHCVKSTVDYVKKIHKLGQEHPSRRSINLPYMSCLKVGKHALEFAEPDVDAKAIFEEEDEDID